MKFLAVAMVMFLAMIHQDFWNWHRIEPLIFGFIPVGLAWHVMISLLAAVLSAFIVRYCWPPFVDALDTKTDIPSPPRH